MLAELSPTTGGLIGAGTVIAGGLIAAAIKLFGGKKNGVCPLPECIEKREALGRRVTVMEAKYTWIKDALGRVELKEETLATAINGQSQAIAMYFDPEFRKKETQHGRRP